jgi:hypothetical protein
MSLLSNSPIENRCYIVNRLANACELYGTKFCLPSSSSLRELSPLLLVDYCVSWQKKEIVNILPSCTAGSGCVNTANLISTYLAAPPPNFSDQIGLLHISHVRIFTQCLIIFEVVSRFCIKMKCQNRGRGDPPVQFGLLY